MKNTKTAQIHTQIHTQTTKAKATDAVVGKTDVSKSQQVAENKQLAVAKAVITHMKKHGHKPSMASTDVKEKHLGNMLLRMRLGIKHMNGSVHQATIDMVKASKYPDLLDIKQATKVISKPSPTSLKKVHTQIDKLAKKAGMPDLFKPKKRK